jgi:hypothetical protein
MNTPFDTGLNDPWSSDSNLLQSGDMQQHQSDLTHSALSGMDQTSEPISSHFQPHVAFHSGWEDNDRPWSGPSFPPGDDGNSSMGGGFSPNERERLGI